MKPLHLALAVANLEESIKDYSARLAADPVCVVDGIYALWRTPFVNLSITVNPELAGTLRHLGFEDAMAPMMSEERDCNGIIWERFSAEQQKEEIFKYWPDAQYHG